MTIFRVVVFLVLVVVSRPAIAQTAEDDVHAFIAQWYAELRKGEEARIYPLMAPVGAVLPTICPNRCGPRPRVMKIEKGPPFPHLLAVRAQQFAYEIRDSRVEQTLARVDVWERGWFWAWAAQQTYENAASATFYLEKREDQWKVALYRSDLRAVHPSHKNDPMPDLSPKDR